MVAAMIISAVATLTSTVMSMSASMQQKKAAESTAAVQSALYEQNAKAAYETAGNTIYAKNVAVDRHRTNLNKLEGAQVATFGAQGLGLSEDISYDTRYLAMLDESNLKFNYDTEANKWYTSAGENLLKSDAVERQGEYASSAADYQMMGTAFKGVGSAVLMYDKFSASNTKTKAAQT